jgi:hypothetical protein
VHQSNPDRLTKAYWLGSPPLFFGARKLHPTDVDFARLYMTRKLLLSLIVFVIVAALGVALVVAPQWPFRENEMKRRIEAASGSAAQFGHFRQVFFPSPGCVIDQLTLTPTDPKRPQIKAEKLAILGSYSGLLGRVKQLHALEAEKLQILIPANADDRSQEIRFPDASASDIAIGEMTARDSEVIIAGGGRRPSTEIYEIHRLKLKDFAPGKKLHFDSTLRLPVPPAEVEIGGDFGPYSGSILREVPLSGKFTMKHADLSKFHALTGIVDAEGKFNGKLGALQVDASTNAPEFGLTDTGHAIPLKTEFSALVDGTKGDVKFQPVHALLGQTKLIAEGQLVSEDNTDAKTLHLDISSDQARIQDLMYLFVQSKPPLQGATRFRGKVRLPDNSRPFTDRVEFQAQFGILGSKFTSAETQQKVGGLSESARGNPKEDDPAPVVTDLLGNVSLKNGIANFSQLSLRVPGASAALHGTYKLQNHAVDLHGTLQTDVKLSQATTGFKAFLMKVVEAAKAKKKEGATVPVKVTGTYEKPEFGLDATSEK